MIEAKELRAAATDYTEAEYQLSKMADRPIPVEQDLRDLFLAEVERCEERVHAVSTRDQKPHRRKTIGHI